MSTEKDIRLLSIYDLVVALGYGHEKAVRRADLCAALGVSDRVMRQLIEEAGASGYLICNDQDGKGYYLARNIEDVARQYAQEKSRMKSLYRRMLPFRRALKEAGRPV